MGNVNTDRTYKTAVILRGLVVDILLYISHTYAD
jgi:hypothetical protein